MKEPRSWLGVWARVACGVAIAELVKVSAMETRRFGGPRIDSMGYLWQDCNCQGATMLEMLPKNSVVLFPLSCAWTAPALGRVPQDGNRIQRETVVQFPNK